MWCCAEPILILYKRKTRGNHQCSDVDCTTECLAMLEKAQDQLITDDLYTYDRFGYDSCEIYISLVIL